MRTPALSTRPAPWGSAIFGALLGVSLSLLIWAPARWLAWGVTQATQSQVQLNDARGTVWAGSAQWVLSGGAGSRDALALPGRFNWTLSPTLSGMRLGLRADCCMTEAASIQMQAGLSTLNLQASDHRSQWPAALLTGLGAPWNTLRPDGQLQLRTEGLQLQWAQGRMQMKGQVELVVKDLSSRLSPIKPIGSYRIALNGTTEGTPTPGLELSTQQGPLLLSGQGQWVGARLRFTGEARAQEGQEAPLANLLNILGRRQGERSLLSWG